MVAPTAPRRKTTRLPLSPTPSRYPGAPLVRKFAATSGGWMKFARGCPSSRMNTPRPPYGLPYTSTAMESGAPGRTATEMGTDASPVVSSFGSP